MTVTGKVRSACSAKLSATTSAVLLENEWSDFMDGEGANWASQLS